ncbi:RING-H2 finger protein ATL65 [Nymphaea colorata]|nr:RING-H2 finger protein ATL65 [Nymphaea colorata]
MTYSRGRCRSCQQLSRRDAPPLTRAGQRGREESESTERGVLLVAEAKRDFRERRMNAGYRPEYDFVWPPAATPTAAPVSRPPPELSPPLIAMMAVVATAFLVVAYSRLISKYLLPAIARLHQLLRRRPSAPSDDGFGGSPSPDSSPFFHAALSSYGLDESAIKTIPLRVFTKGKRFLDGSHDCAVCLLEFDSGDYLRVLPGCHHAFHVDCIDIWLRSHANCPLCRAGIFRSNSPFIPVMAARIRPSLDDSLLRDIIIEAEIRPDPAASEARASPFSSAAASPDTTKNDFGDEATVPATGRSSGFLKRSYSFGFESNLATERLVLEATTASPWRYRRGGVGSGFWAKRPSPFCLKPSVFSFRSLKSPFFRRRSTSSLTGFFPLSESRVHGGASSSSSRRCKSMTSPMFVRSVVAFSSSRLRSGDPEALLSPERFNRR